MSIVSEVLTYQGLQCYPSLLLYEEGIIGKDSILSKNTTTIEQLKAEDEKFIAIILAMDNSPLARKAAKPLKEILRAMPRELWYVSWLTIAGQPEAIVVHRGIEGDMLKELYKIYDCESLPDRWVNAYAYGKLKHTIDIDFLIINPVREWNVQTEQEGNL